jgi:hypothetical protein
MLNVLPKFLVAKLDRSGATNILALRDNPYGQNASAQHVGRVSDPKETPI